MSEKMIARWNEIHERLPNVDSLKRERPEDEQDSDDDISLVSRSPSPPAIDDMEIDEVRITKYDEYHQGSAREVITVDTKIKSTNKGFALLTKLGWREGQPVGLDADGRTEPVPFYIKRDLTGVGKTNQDYEMIETTVFQRRELDSERQQRETNEQRQVREHTVARKYALEAEISSTLRAFYCELCDKQFQTVAQYDEHTNSYAHHHKARAKDMQDNSRLKAQADIDKRKEKERKREERELRKMAAAKGIKIPKPAAVSAGVLSSTSEPALAMDVDGPPAEPPRNSGWASSSGGQASTAGAGIKISGWAAVGSSSAPPPPQDPAPAPPPPSVQPPLPLDPPPPGPPQDSLKHTPSFHNAGWTALSTGSAPLPNSTSPPNLPSGGGWARVGATTPQPSRPTEPSQPPALEPPVTTQPAVPPPQEARPARSNWQQFQKGVGRRKV